MNAPELNPYRPPAAAVEPLLEDHELVYQEASKGKRFLNFILDRIAVMGVAFGAGVVIVLLEEAGMIDGGMRWLERLSGLEDMVFTAVLTIFYYSIMESLFGRSLGKLITGTKVLNDAGFKPSLGAILGRTLARIVPFEPFSFFGERGWHDSWSGTQVVDVRKPKVAKPRASVLRYYR